MGNQVAAAVQDELTEAELIVSYDPDSEQWNVNGINVSRIEALEDDERIVMLQGEGIVAHVLEEDLRKIVHRANAKTL